MYDVIIIGAGVVGASIAREISRYQLKTVVVEKGSDVAVGTSKANSGIVHGGYSEKPGTLKAKYNVEGQKLFDQLAEELDFSFKRCGSLVVCFNEEGKMTLEALRDRGIENGLEGLSILNKEEVKVLEPNISQQTVAALHIPMGGIVSPYGMTVAYAENAANNGVEFLFNYEVGNVSKEEDGRFKLTSINEQQVELKGKIVINAAGLFSGDINNMLSKNKIEIRPRLGEYILLDTTESNLVNRTIFQLPTKMGKGVLVTPTVGGNILIGPTTIEINEKDDVSVTVEGLKKVMDTGTLTIENLRRDKIITSFAGLRAHSTTDDFIIEEAKDVSGLINLCGIESPGLTAAPAIAKTVENMVVSLLNPPKNEKFNPIRKAAPVFRKLSHKERDTLIKQDKDYGNIICRCEMVTKGEIKNALLSPLQVKDVDGIKRRTRTGMGRCQGGFCYMKILNIMAEELGIDIKKITKSGGQSNFLIEENKASL